MKNKNYNTQQKSTLFLFGKRNYILMGIGLVIIAAGLLLMTGHDANTNSEGVYDANYWNNSVFSFRRLRLSSLLIIIGFIIECYAIMANPKKKTKTINNS